MEKCYFSVLRKVKISVTYMLKCISKHVHFKVFSVAWSHVFYYLIKKRKEPSVFRVAGDTGAHVQYLGLPGWLVNWSANIVSRDLQEKTNRSGVTAIKEAFVTLLAAVCRFTQSVNGPKVINGCSISLSLSLWVWNCAMSSSSRYA